MPSIPQPSMTLGQLLNRGLPKSTLIAPAEEGRSILSGSSIVEVLHETTRNIVIDDRLSAFVSTVPVFATASEAAAFFVTLKYDDLGGASGFLGSATTEVVPCPDGEGFHQHFQGGSVYWHPAAGGHEVHGDIRGKWHLALGAEASFLGYPTTDETGTPDGIGRFNHFQAGSIYWTPSTGAHEVHGLIRDLWAAHGWERNQDLGYPISDELIPDRQIGNRRPQTRRKPVLGLPPDVVKLPAEASDLGFPTTVTNQVTNQIVSTQIRSASTAASDSSRNRFSDFENGVVFWRRGETAAQRLAPSPTAPDGSRMHLTADDIVSAARPFIDAALGSLSGATLAAVTFVGTTHYWFDGLSVHNRCHRILVGLLAFHRLTPLVPVEIPSSAGVELRVQVSFEPTNHVVRGLFVDWSPVSIANDLTADPPLIRQLHARLDPLLWSGFDLLTVPVAGSGAPIAVLSAKTTLNGEVDVYIEP